MHIQLLSAQCLYTYILVLDLHVQQGHSLEAVVNHGSDSELQFLFRRNDSRDGLHCENGPLSSLDEACMHCVSIHVIVAVEHGYSRQNVYLPEHTQTLLG